MSKKTAGKPRNIANNRRAWHDYEILDRLECGISLVGSEVKSLRAGRARGDIHLPRPKVSALFAASQMAKREPEEKDSGAAQPAAKAQSLARGNCTFITRRCSLTNGQIRGHRRSRAIRCFGQYW